MSWQLWQMSGVQEARSTGGELKNWKLLHLHMCPREKTKQVLASQPCSVVGLMIDSQKKKRRTDAAESFFRCRWSLKNYSMQRLNSFLNLNQVVCDVTSTFDGVSCCSWILYLLSLQIELFASLSNAGVHPQCTLSTHSPMRDSWVYASRS